MAYLFKEKFQIEELVAQTGQLKKILIAEAENYLSALYASHFARQKFQVMACQDLEQLLRQVGDFQPHLLVVNPGLFQNDQHVRTMLSRVRALSPSLLVVSIGNNVPLDIIKQLMTCGVSSHLERHLTRPQDLVVVVRTLFNL